MLSKEQESEQGGGGGSGSGVGGELEEYRPVQPLCNDHGVTLIPLVKSTLGLDLHTLQVMTMVLLVVMRIEMVKIWEYCTVHLVKNFGVL